MKTGSPDDRGTPIEDRISPAPERTLGRTSKESGKRRATVLGLPKRWLWGSAAAVFAVGTAGFAYVFQTTPGYLFRHDGAGYFLYAHSIVTDLDTEVTDDYRALDAVVPAGSPALSGLRTRREPEPERVVLPWPIGSGLVMAPFYAAGYGLELAAALLAGRPADPFGILPQYFFGLGSLAYGWLGMLATFFCCRRVTGDAAAWIATLVAILAGPAVFYIVFHPTMAHASSFGLVALFVLLWWRRWAGEPQGIGWLGLLIGVLITVRYQNAIFALLLLALLVHEARSQSWRAAGRAGLAAGAASLPPLVLQAAHLSKVHGTEIARQHWRSEELVLGQNPMDPSSPFFFDVLFSCQHGAVSWAPMVGLACLGLLAAARGSSWAALFGLVFLADVYLVGCLRGPIEIMESLAAPPSPAETNWSGGHAFGMRYLTECAPLLAAGLAALLQRFRAGIGRRLLAVALGAVVLWNGLLLLAYGMATIDRVGCVTHGEMAAGVVEALRRLVAG